MDHQRAPKASVWLWDLPVVQSPTGNLCNEAKEGSQLYPLFRNSPKEPSAHRFLAESSPPLFGEPKNNFYSQGSPALLQSLLLILSLLKFHPAQPEPT